MTDAELERELDAFYEKHRHEWEFGIGDLVVIESQGTGRYKDHCIYLGQDESDCHHRWWDMGRQRIISTPWKQARLVSRMDWI